MPQENLGTFFISPPQFTFRIRSGRFGNKVIKEVGLISRSREGALKEIRELFNKEIFKGNEGIFSLAEHAWDRPIKKGATTVIKEMPLVIMKLKAYFWDVAEGGDFTEVSN